MTTRKKPTRYLVRLMACVIAVIALAQIHMTSLNRSVGQNLPATLLTAPSELLLLSHAGGGLKSGIYSNSLEAFDRAHADGLRVFEVDFSWSSDAHLLALHDWTAQYDYWFAPSLIDRAVNRIRQRLGSLTLPTSRDEFLAKPMRSGVTPMDIELVLGWLDRHPDSVLVTDIKSENVKGLSLIAQLRPDLSGQIIPQIYAFEEYQPVRELGFSRIILTTYRQNMTTFDILEKAKPLDLFAVTLGYWRVLEIADYGVARLPFPVFVHTINDPKTALELQSKGVFGVYTDYLLPAGDDPQAFDQ